MKYAIPNMLEFTLDSNFLVSLSDALAWLSSLMIKVYDFHIILYFYLVQIMQNKPNFRNDKMNANSVMTRLYGIFWLCGRQKKTNPI
jgi:hypothetical protein